MTVTKRKPKPITAHPMFPAVTALWFAAFLSLGSFAVAPALLEGPVVALGIPEILPAAQPPLGFTVRALVAIVMMGVGGLVGYLIGRRLAQGKVEAPVRARSFGSSAFGRSDEQAAAPARQPLHRRPLNPSEDLGDPMGDAAFAPPSVFAAASDVETPWDEATDQTALEVTRLPWEDDRSASAVRDALADHALADDPLALDLLFEDAEILAEDSAATEHQEFVTSAEAVTEVAFDVDEPAEAPAAELVEELAEAKDFAATEDFADPVPDRAGVPLIKVPLMQAPAITHVPLARTPIEELGLVQLTERLALAIGRRNARAKAVPQAATPAPPYAVPTVEAFVPAPVSEPVSDSEPESVPEGPIGDVGEFSVAAPQQAPTLARFQSAAVENADTDDQAPALETERVVQLRPAALQPFVPEFDADEDEDVPGLARFLRAPTSQPVLEPTEASDEEDEFDDEEHDDTAPDFVWSAEAGADPDVAEERYPSLLDMGSGGNRHQAIQLSHDDADADGDEADASDAEPVVVFPGQSSPIHASPRPFERPSAMGGPSDLPASIIPVPGSPLASPGRAAPSSPIDTLAEPVSAVTSTIVEAEEADRALRAALATLQRMTAQG